LERITVYKADNSSFVVSDDPWVTASGNQTYQRHFMSWISLFALLILYPLMSSIQPSDQSALDLLKDDFVWMIGMITTIIFQWILFLMVFGTTHLEKTGLAGIGFQPFIERDISRGGKALLYVGYALTFLLVANLLLAGLSYLLAQVGLPMDGDLKFVLPRNLEQAIIWVPLSFTAGFCEEVMFRGYLMTRLRLLFKTKSWIPSILISSMAFGLCHTYQGLSGFIVITVYGAMFALLYIRTGSIWPGIIAHALQDVSAPFFPQ